MRVTKSFLFLFTIVLFVQGLLLNPINTHGYNNVIKSDDVTVKIKAKPMEQFDLITPPIQKVDKVVVGSQMIQTRLNFNMPAQVIDIRGEHDGWELSISAEKFHNKDHVLPKGTLSLEALRKIIPISENAVLPRNMMKRNTIIDDGGVMIAKANEGEGMGVFELDFGDEPLIVNLDPKRVESGVYETEITWTLESGSGEKRILKQDLIELEIEKTKNASGMVRDGEGKGNRTNEKSGDVTNGISGDAAKGKDVNKDGVGSSVTSDKSDERKNDVRKKEGSNEGGLKLPQTATPYFNFMLFGLLVLLIGIIFYYINKKMLEKRLEEDE